MGQEIRDWRLVIKVSNLQSPISEQGDHDIVTSTISVKLFATLRQTAGWSEKPIELAGETTVRELLARLMDENPGLDLNKRSIYAAVNEDFADADQVLHDGDKVAIFPPVSGGNR